MTPNLYSKLIFFINSHFCIKWPLSAVSLSTTLMNFPMFCFYTVFSLSISVQFVKRYVILTPSTVQWILRFLLHAQATHRGIASEDIMLLWDHSSEGCKAYERHLEGEIKCLLGPGGGPFTVSHLWNLSPRTPPTSPGCWWHPSPVAPSPLLLFKGHPILETAPLHPQTMERNRMKGMSTELLAPFPLWGCIYLLCCLSLEQTPSLSIYHLCRLCP